MKNHCKFSMVRWSWINTKYRFDCFAAYLRHLFEIFWWKHFIPFFIKEMKIFQVKLLQAPTGDLLQIYKMVLQHGFSSNYILGNWKQKQNIFFLLSKDNNSLNKKKPVDIKFSATTHFWNDLHQVRSKSKDW